MKVYILQDYIRNFRVPVFQRLAKLPNVDLTVFHFNLSNKFKEENIKQEDNFSGFNTIKLQLWKINNKTYKFNFIEYLIFQKPDCTIIGSVNFIELILFVFFCSIRRIKFLWWKGGIPYIDLNLYKKSNNQSVILKLLGKQKFQTCLESKANGMITYSDHAKTFYKTKGFRKDIFVANNSPDTDSLLKYKKYYLDNPKEIMELRKKYAPNNEKIILMIGRLNRERKTDLLLKSFKIIQQKLQNIKLLIIGEGIELEGLKAIVDSEKMEYKVHFVGGIYEDKILTKYLMLCDVYVTPGIASMTIKMAMCLGKPVVSVAYGLEIHAINNGENGFIVDIDDSIALADKIIFLLGNEIESKRISENAAKFIKKKVNINTMIDGFKEAFNHLF